MGTPGIRFEPKGPRPRRWGRYVALAAVAVPFAAIVAFAALAAVSRTGLSADGAALARLSMPLGGGSVQRLTVVGGRERQLVRVSVRDGRIWPQGTVGAGERVSVDVTIRRPGWIGWLAGSTQRVRMTLVTPAARLRTPYITVRPGHPLRVAFRDPVRVVSYAPPGAPLRRQVLPTATTTYSLGQRGTAGTVWVAAAPRAWERAKPILVSWFPAGAKATAVASPAPGSSISPTSRITLTFSKPVTTSLGSNLPPVSPAGAGVWRQIDSHRITFVPSGYGYGLGASVSIPLPAGVELVGGTPRGADPVGRWSVPAGSTLRLQQLLAMLNYLPVSFRYAGAGVSPTPEAEVAAAIHPPVGSFAWRYPNVPAGLRAQWSPGTSGVVTRGAVMAFENDHGLSADGVAGPSVWKALIAAAIRHQRSTFGYTYVMVSEGSPESISVWHNGRTVVSGPVNTGVAAAPTATGVYPVFEHLPVTTMSGTNPDGSHYKDPGIPWVSYFNGGDALHGFIRGSYGYPQSDGCVEMPYGQAAKVYPYTPIGTLVDVS
jgi:peptidoglycan hydrolase-like protein with peptidoglycan-binding domain